MVFRKFMWAGVGVIAAALAVSGAGAQKALRNNDVAVDGFAEFTSTASGNGITVTPTKAGGGALQFRHSYHWWLGYEAGYAYSRYTNFYTGQPFGIQSNMHDFSAAYYVHGKALALEPFATAGASAVLFAPSLNGGQNASHQTRPGANFGVGLNYPLLTSHIGLRLEYRGVYYKTPDFGQAVLTTNAFRLTSEPMAGIYLKF